MRYANGSTRIGGMRDIFLIKGLAGRKTLSGTLPVQGAKNAALPAFAASLLFKDGMRLTNVPYIEDIRRSVELLEDLGVAVYRDSADSWTVGNVTLKTTDLNRELSKHMRASIVFTGPVLARYGQVSFPHPGGCVLGERPVDMFLSAFEKMGANVKVANGIYNISTHGKKLRGADIFLHVQSHTATETLMMAAILADGRTTIRNAAMEPEVANVADFLNSCGAKISGAGTPTVVVEGGSLLFSRRKAFHTIPDRIEAGSFLILAALAGENIAVTGCEPKHLDSLTNSLKMAGVPLKVNSHSISVRAAKSMKSGNADFHAVNIKTHEYPGFSTDLQAPFAVFLTQVTGESRVFETIFEGRLNYASDLVKMGADVHVWNSHEMTIKGPKLLKGRELDGPDIRAGLAYVLAAITARGRSVINNIHLIDRGYQRIEERLKAVGVDIERVSN